VRGSLEREDVWCEGGGERVEEEEEEEESRLWGCPKLLLWMRFMVSFLCAIEKRQNELRRGRPAYRLA
jgi:hypothetical protein